jgi:DNA-binding CsgD family transcriptional regulator
VLQEGFGLTPAEARLACALLAGGTLKDAATRIGISPNTAKTQLQVVFQKTRTGRQQELVSLLRSIPH